jgi:hypothetical protein
MLVALIHNNPAALTPHYDSHAIDIVLGLLALVLAEDTDQAKKWVNDLSARIIFAYRVGRYFPIASDSYDDLVASIFPVSKVDFPFIALF